MKYRIWIVCVMLWWQDPLQARPVSYASGVTLMQMNNQDAHRFHLHYSPSIHYSIGYKAEFWQDQDWQFQGVQVNYLIKRWNQPASQANLYLKTAVGIVLDDSDTTQNTQTSLGGFTGISADWENRRFFTQYENQLYDAGDVNQFFSQKFRVGIAPYIGDYGDLHTWLMLQVDHNPEATDSIVITPLVRLFKSEYLTEFGITDHGDVLLNFVIRY